MHLAAAAPGLQRMLAEMVRRLRDLETPYRRDARRVELAQLELDAATPSREAWLELAGRDLAQLELDPGDEVA